MKEGTLPFQWIAMDLITGLPQHHGHNAILTIVDHGCSHAAIFLPCSDTIMGPGITQLYLDYVRTDNTKSIRLSVIPEDRSSASSALVKQTTLRCRNNSRPWMLTCSHLPSMF